MASTRPFAAGSVPLGSTAWISNELKAISQLEAQDLEEFAYAARNDLEWLNEHMADIFERNTMDMVELMKTPGKLRGKTPRTERKQQPVAEDREVTPNSDIFTSHRTPESRNQFTKALHELQSNPDPEPAPSPIPKSPAKTHPPPPQSPAKHQDLQISPAKPQFVKPASPSRQNSKVQAAVPERAEPANSFADSGFFTASQADTQVDIPETTTIAGRATRARASAADDVFVDAKSSPQQQQRHSIETTNADDVDAANQLREEQEEATQESEVEEEPEHHESPVSRPHKSPIKSPLSLKKEVHSEAEVRKSGRIASKDSPEPGRNSGVRRSSRRKDSTPAPEPVPVEPDLQPELAPEPEQAYVAGVQQPVEGVHDGEPVEEELEPTQKDPVSEDEKSDSSRSPSPGLPVIRKSSMSFASLPARTTLGGKKSLGARATRDSHIDQPPGRQTTGRAGSIEKSFIKSLGENSRPLAALQTPAPPSAKKGKKRNSDGHVIDEMVDNRQEDIIMHETQETTKIPTKTGSEEPEEDSRRKTKVSLHDKIQLLQSGKMKNRYLPPPDHEPEYPSLLSMDLDRPEEPIMKTPGMESGRLKKSLEALREPYQSALEEDRDMDLSDSRPYNRVQADVPMMNDTFSRNHSPVLRPSPLRTEAYPTIPARNASPLSSPFTRDPETGPPSSPLKKAFSYNSVVDVHDRGTLPSSPRRALPTEEDFSQTKTSMSTMTQKAKDMWMRNDTGTVTRSEIASPPTKRWQGDDVFRSPRLPAKSQSYDRLDDTLKRSLYPELATRSSSEIIDERQVRSPRAKSRMEESPRTWSRMEETPRSKTRLDDYPRQTSPKRTIGRQTRSSKTRDEMEWQSPAPLSRTSSKKLREEEEEAKALAEAQERQRRQEEQLRREKELLRKMQEQQRRQAEEDRRAAEEERRRIEEERRQLEEERRRHEEEIRARDQAERDRASAEAYQEPEEEYEREEGARSRAGSVDPERAQSRLQQKGSLRMQRPSEFSKPPLRLTKSAPKVKPPPTTIKIGTASQRELMDQRRINTTGGPSVSQLKSAFEPPPQRPESRSAAPAPPAARKVRSLEIAAMQRQREQETLEKKQAEKRELEKRKAEKRKTQEEEQRRMQAARQRPTTAMSGSSSTTTSGPTKTLNRVPQMSNLRQPSQEPEGGKTYGKLNYAKGPGGSIKRVLPQDEDHAPREQPPSRNIPSRLGVPSYQQDGQKKRRTNDFNEDHHMDDQPQPPQRLMQQQKGPIRNSMLGKGGPGSMLPSKMPMHGYTSASNNPATQHSTIKTVGPPSAATGGPGKKLPHVDSVKYSQEKIRFAGEATPGAGAYGGSFKTPHAKSTVKGKKAKTPAAESPLYQNGEDIELPQIPTDSEDDDDDDDYKNASIPSWAMSPMLTQILQQQETQDPEAIFGTIRSPDMEAIFKGMDERRVARFRARTSSANWGGADGLTAREREIDMQERRKLQEKGHWTFPEEYKEL